MAARFHTRLHHQCRLLCCALIALLIAATASAELIVSHRSPLDAGAHRYVYDIKLLRLALEKTRGSHGDFKMVGLPPTNFPRLRSWLHNDTYPNLVLESSYDRHLQDSGALTYINFPVDLGVIGYRICFVAPKLKAEIAQVKTLAELRKYRIGQGTGWTDVEILRYNGFQVVEVNSYESLFKMIAAGRFELLCRGINELMKELEQYRGINQLSYDESFMLVYRMPRFFYLRANNPALKERLEIGLARALADGSLLELWQRENGASLRFAQLQQRRVFYLDNPLILNLPQDFLQYFIDPVTLELPWSQQVSETTQTPRTPETTGPFRIKTIE